MNKIKYSEQRDEETGYGYFGARYMDYELMTMWLSVDPMADKYPGIGPYAYCASNPVKLVDPDEMYNEAIEKHGQGSPASSKRPEVAQTTHRREKSNPTGSRR